MTKNTKTILLSLLACLLLITGFELGEGRLRFGGATLNDSLTSRVTINKGLQVNGVITSSDTLRTSGILRSTELQLTGASPQILWTTYGMNIDGGIDALSYNSNAHSFNTEAGTVAMYADTATGFQSYLPGYSNNGRGLLRTKVVQSTLGGTTPGNNVNVAHGISAVNKILGFDVTIWEDSLARYLNPGFAVSTPLTTGSTFSIDATNCIWFIPAASGGLKNTGDTIRWTIRYLE